MKHVEVLVKIRELALLILGDLDPCPPNPTRRASPPPDVRRAPNGRVLRNNGRHIIVQIATVVEKLPQSFKDAHPDIEWVQIARMRHLIAHHYDNVNDRLVYSALAKRVPRLVAALGIDTSPPPTSPPSV